MYITCKKQIKKVCILILAILTTFSSLSYYYRLTLKLNFTPTSVSSFLEVKKNNSNGIFKAIIPCALVSRYTYKRSTCNLILTSYLRNFTSWQKRKIVLWLIATYHTHNYDTHKFISLEDAVINGFLNFLSFHDFQ